jgi:hypothetical protein
MHFISSLGLFLFKLCKRSSNLNENHPFFVFEIFWGLAYWEQRCGQQLPIRQDPTAGAPVGYYLENACEDAISSVPKRRTHRIAP